MLLRNELQTALQDVEVACLEVADGHDGAADILADDPLAPTLRELAGERRAAAERLGECIRELDDLPAEPDADLETARDLATRVMAALSGDQHHTRRCRARRRRGPPRRRSAEQALAQPELSPASPRPARADPRPPPRRAATPREPRPIRGVAHWRRTPPAQWPGDRQAMDPPGFGVAPAARLAREGHWAVSVSGNWRVTFRFEDGDAVDVDYLDDH